MAAVWPPSLPQRQLVDGYEETLPNIVVRTQMEAGAAKVRRRYTAAVTPVRCNVVLTAAQAETLRTFFVDTVAGGALPFDWVNPLSNAAATYRFVEPPRWSALKPGLVMASLSLEIMP